MIVFTISEFVTMGLKNINNHIHKSSVKLAQVNRIAHPNEKTSFNRLNHNPMPFSGFETGGIPISPLGLVKLILDFCLWASAPYKPWNIHLIRQFQRLALPIANGLLKRLYGDRLHRFNTDSFDRVFQHYVQHLEKTSHETSLDLDSCFDHH